jgi:hypothetical protein
VRVHPAKQTTITNTVLFCAEVRPEASGNHIKPCDPAKRVADHFDVSRIPKNVVRTVFVFRARSLGGNGKPEIS